MKSLLLISHSSNKVGGGEDDFLRLLKYLQNKFYIYSVFPYGDRAAEFAELSNKYIIIPSRIFPGYKFNFKKYLAFIFYSVKKIIVLIPFLKESKNYDLCFVNSSVCFVEMRLLKYFKIPYIVSVKEKLNPGFLRKYVYKLIDKSALKVIVISGFLKNLLKETIKQKEIIIIRTSIDEAIYNTLKSEISVLGNKNKFVILSIGQIYELKNQLLLVEAISKLKNKNTVLIKFIGFVVDKEYNNLLLNKINEYGLQNLFEFHGAISKKEIITEYMNSDAVIITSKEEGMSLVLVEALFFEKPVITTNVGIIPEVIKNGENGIIINKNDPVTLTDALEELINNKNLYNKIKSNSINTYKENFNLQKALEEHLKLFNECI